MRDRVIFHVELNDQHFYFGSMAAIYQHFTDEQVGMTYRSLQRVFKQLEEKSGNTESIREEDKSIIPSELPLSTTVEYKTKKCIIRKGTVTVAQKISNGNKPAYMLSKKDRQQ